MRTRRTRESRGRMSTQYTMEALVLFSTPEAEEAAAGTTKKAAAPTAPLFASRTGRMEMKLVTVMAMVAPWPGMTIFFFGVGVASGETAASDGEEST